MPLLASPQVEIHDRSKVIGHELLGRRALRKGNWKLLMTPKPLGSGEWELFNIGQDPGEQNNRAADKPQVMQDMLQEWARYEKENDLVYADSSPI